MTPVKVEEQWELVEVHSAGKDSFCCFVFILTYLCAFALPNFAFLYASCENLSMPLIMLVQFACEVCTVVHAGSSHIT